MSTTFTSVITRRAVPGDRYFAVATLTGPTSYTTGGVAVTKDLFGFTFALDFVDVGNSSAAHPVFYDAANGKLKFFTAQGTEVAAAVNVSTITVNCLAFGY